MVQDTVSFLPEFYLMYRIDFWKFYVLEIMQKTLNYAKMCGKRQIIWKVPHLPHLNVGYDDYINRKENL